MNKLFTLTLSLVVTISIFGCVGGSSENENAVNPSSGTEVHITNWMPTHKNEANADLDSCRNCHGYNLDGGTVDISCITCHPDAPDNFTNFHGTKVELTTNSTCENCHTVSGASVNPNDDKVHDSCTTTCHDANYQLISPAPANAPSHNATGGTCTACHDANFNNHTHGTATGYVSHSISYDEAGGDTSQSTPQGCNDCHGTGGSSPYSLTSSSDILTTHSNDCAKCHQYDGTNGVYNTTSSSDVSNAVGNNGASIYCRTCHSDKTPNVDHGTHDSNTFDWDGICSGCHGSGGTAAVISLHTSCTLCHATSAGGIGSTVAGTDGDANLGKGAVIGDYTTATCTTCHIKAAYTIHHVNDGSVAYTALDDCVDCHTAGYAGDHQNLIDDVAPCLSCHTGTAPADANNTPVSLADDKIHDACKTCHKINTGSANIVELVTASGSVTTMDNADGTTATDNGGGFCDHCHTAYFDAHGHDHTTTVTKTTSCTTAGCHDPTSTGTARGTGSNTPFVGAGLIHAACTTCHSGATGALINGGAGQGNATINGGAGGSCSDCHGGWEAIHDGAALPSHATFVTKTGSSCVTTCHDAVVGGSQGTLSVTTPYITSTEVHFISGQPGCTTCHDSDGSIRLDGSLTLANTITQGNCNDCHSSTWITLHTNATVSHTTYVAAEASCRIAGCHDSGSTGVARGTSTATAYTGAADVHSGGCPTCHNTDGTMKNGGAGQGNATLGAGNCSHCHTSGWESIHTSVALVNHSASVAALAACTTCHTGTGGNAQISLNNGATRAADLLHDICTDCHTAAGALDTTKNGVGVVLGTVASGNCSQCHTAAYFDSHVHGTGTNHTVSLNTAIDRSQETDDASTSCEKCHTPADNLANFASILTEHSGDCDTCHDYATNGNVTGSADTPVLATVQSAISNNTVSTCITCHAKKEHTQVTSTHGAHSDLWDAKVSWTSSCENAGCHGTDDVINVISVLHSATAGNCDICHVNAAGGGALIAVLEGNGTAVDGGPCVDCHNSGLGLSVAFHGVTAALVAGRHDKLATSEGSLSSSSSTIPSYRAVGYSGKIDIDTYGGLLAADYNCSDCHTTATTDIIGEHGSDTNVAGCIVCHNGIANFETIITNGKGGADQNCEKCHNATINGGGSTNAPSGEAMYQYDGDRHHKTSYAQRGECTYCHADPRPATPTQATGYAGTAALVGDSTDGFITDYSTSTPAPIPDQPACRLCHTNYETHIVDVFATQTNNTTHNATADLHGYNIDGQATGYSATGLTIYADNYDDNGSTLSTRDYPSGSSNMLVYGVKQVEQTEVHRIDPNTGTDKILVDNYGSCFACHSVQLFHAAPISGIDYPAASSDEHSLPFDTLRYAPGRHVFNILMGDSGSEKGNNADDWDQHREPEKFLNETWKNDRGDNLMNDTFSKNPSSDPDDCELYCDELTLADDYATQEDVPSDSSFNNFENLGNGLPTNGTLYSGKGGGIFTFTNDPTLPLVDNINITYAFYNGTTIEVHAYNSLGAAQTLSFTYSNGASDCGTQAMAWSVDHYEGTCATPVAFTPGTDTVTVSNTTTGSVLDARTRLVAN